jgi:hypothetical protein
MSKLMPFIAPSQETTYELCLKEVKRDGLNLQRVPYDHKTYELCFEAVKNNGWAIEYVLKQFRTYEMYIEAVEQNRNVLEIVPCLFYDRIMEELFTYKR